MRILPAAALLLALSAPVFADDKPAAKGPTPEMKAEHQQFRKERQEERKAFREDQAEKRKAFREKQAEKRKAHRERMKEMRRRTSEQRQAEKKAGAAPEGAPAPAPK